MDTLTSFGMTATFTGFIFAQFLFNFLIEKNR